MVKHSPPFHTGNPVAHLQAVNEVTLDHWKHGDISQAEALQRFEAAAAMLVQTLREQFVIRLRNLEAFQTPRGEVVPTPREK